ncbi:MAG: 1-acyl-sn-glycerol-3-phosphate acyltransferase, partial [Streptococcus gallolyticus]
NPLTYIYRIPLGLVAIIVVLLTLLFSYIASFVWDPDKHRKMK